MQRGFLFNNSKQELMALVVVLMAAFSMASPGAVLAADLVRPPSPVIDYAPQAIGMYDTYYDSYGALDCRQCHGDRDAGAARHQLTESAFADYPDGCQLSPPGCRTACHPDPENPATITSDCLTENCHPTYTGANSGGPHHETDFSDSGQCTACHRPDLLVETGSTRLPSYFPAADISPPTPHNCENCHWPTNCSEVLPDRLDPTGLTDDVGKLVIGATQDSDNDTKADACADNDALFDEDWSYWPDPKPGPLPAPIMANGKTYYGTLYFSPPTSGKAFMSVTGTHHEVGVGVYGKCYWCHAAAPNSPVDIDPYSVDPPLFIRYCQNCHSAESLHNIEGHMQTKSDYTVRGVLHQVVTGSEKCVGCHGGIPTTTPVSGPKPPVITGISPRYGPGGTTACTVTGENFGASGDVLLAPKMVGAGQAFRISSVACTFWTDSSIRFTVPAGLDPRNYNVRVETPYKLSNTRVFTVTGPPECIAYPSPLPTIACEPDMGTPGIVVSLTATDFGDQQADDRVQMRVENPPLSGNFYWEDVPVYSWSEGLVEFYLPGGSFWTPLPVTAPIRVVKAGIGNSNQVDFTVKKHPEIWEDGYTTDTWDTTLDIPGVGFNIAQQNVPAGGYCYSTYVEVHSPDDKYRVTSYGGTWTGGSFQCTLGSGHVMDIETGVAVPSADLHPGDWGLQVITDFFLDDGDGVYFNTTSGSLDLSADSLIDLGEWDDPATPENEQWNLLDGPNGTGGGDKLFYRAVSEPASFTVPLVRVDLAPDTTPTVIPRGQPLGFQVAITNNTDKTGKVHFVTFLTPPPPYERYPGSGWLDHYEPKMTPYGEKAGYISHTIPITWPLGTYIYHVWVGNPGPVIYGEGQFEFEVVEAP